LFVFAYNTLVLQDAVKKLAYELFHEHKQPSEDQMKQLIKEKLDADEHCVEMLKKCEGKGFTYDDLWNEKINSAVSNISILVS